MFVSGSTYVLPSVYASAIINGDYSSTELDDNDRDAIRKIITKVAINGEEFVDVHNLSYFSRVHDATFLGVLPCMVSNYVTIKHIS